MSNQVRNSLLVIGGSGAAYALLPKNTEEDYILATVPLVGVLVGVAMFVSADPLEDYDDEDVVDEIAQTNPTSAMVVPPLVVVGLALAAVWVGTRFDRETERQWDQLKDRR